jgi:pimeloyl-ACP methyl ester carboxylesterase
VRVDEHTIEVGGAPVFYRSAPTDGVPVVYLHSAPTSCDDWSDGLQRTGGIAPDLPGFGRSGKGGHLDYTPTGYEVFLAAFLEVTGTERVSIVGHGWGGAFALALAQSRPGQVERLVLVDAVPLLPGFRWPTLVRRLRTPALGELIMGSINRRLLARALRGASATPQAWPDARVDTVWQQFDQGTQRAILRLHRALDGPSLAAGGNGLDRLEQPTMVVWGELDPWIDPRFGQFYSERLPRARLELIREAGHWPWLDRPEVIDLIAEFAAGAG